MVDVLRDAKAIYLKDHADVSLVLNLGASGVLQTQIEQGAPVDVYISAGVEQAAALARQGLVDSAFVRTFAHNRLVLIAAALPSSQVRDGDTARATADHAGGEGEIKERLELLRGPGFRHIAIASEATAPAGRYAARALRAAGLYDALRPRLVPGADVRHVLEYVASGAAGAGFVYRTDALASDGVRIVLEIPVEMTGPVVYQMALIAGSDHPKEARELFEFLSSAPVRDLLRKRGFDAD